MKLEQSKIDIQGGFGIESYDAEVSQEDFGKMWEMFQNPYKNSIGSIVRETVSNGFDSHAEAKVTDPVLVKFDTTETGYSITIKDVGVGISPERIQIIKTYLKSTKNNTNGQIGGIGIGFKSPLSYRDYFNIKSVYNGTYYHYMMRKGEIKPTIELIEKKDVVDISNYSEIIIDIKNQTDLVLFIKETYNQLYYLNNVVVDYDNIIDQFPGHSYSSLSKDKVKDYLNQDYKIIEGKHFYCRLDENSFAPSKMHISNGNVKYPIDWENIGLKSSDFEINIGLKFDIGDLSVIFTREDIRYTESNIKKVKDKIELVKQELTELFNKQTKEIDSIEKFVDFCKIDYYHVDVINQDIPKSLIDIEKLILPTFQDIVFKDYDDYNNLKKRLNSYSVFNIQIPSFKKRNNSGSFTQVNNGIHTIVGNLRYSNNYNIYELKNILTDLKINKDYKIAVKSGETPYKALKNKYLNDLRCNHIIGKPKLKIIKREVKHNYSNNYKLLIKYLCKDLAEEFKDHIIDYDNLVVPDSFKPVKQLNTTIKPKNTFKVEYLHYDGGKFNSKTYNLGNTAKDDYFNIETLNEAIVKTKNIFGILTSSDNLYKYKDNYYSFFRILSKSYPMIYSVSPTNYTKLLKEKNRKFITIEEYFNTSKMKYRIIPEFIAFNKFIEENPEFSSSYYFDSFEKVIDLPIYKKNTKLTETIEKIKNYRTLFDDGKFKDLISELTVGFKDIKIDNLFKEELEILNEIKKQKINVFNNMRINYSPFLNFLSIPLEDTFIKNIKKQKEYLVEDIFKDDITVDNFVEVFRNYSPYGYGQFVTEEEIELFKTDNEAFKNFILSKIKYLLFSTSYLTGSKLVDFELVNYYIKNK